MRESRSSSTPPGARLTDTHTSRKPQQSLMRLLITGATSGSQGSQGSRVAKRRAVHPAPAPASSAQGIPQGDSQGQKIQQLPLCPHLQIYVQPEAPVSWATGQR